MTPTGTCNSESEVQIGLKMLSVQSCSVPNCQHICEPSHRKWEVNEYAAWPPSLPFCCAVTLSTQKWHGLVQQSKNLAFCHCLQFICSVTVSWMCHWASCRIWNFRVFSNPGYPTRGAWFLNQVLNTKAKKKKKNKTKCWLWSPSSMKMKIVSWFVSHHYYHKCLYACFFFKFIW